MKDAFVVEQLGQQPAQDSLRQTPSMAGGIDLRDNPENLSPGSSPDMDDVEVSLDGRLVVAPGVTLSEILTRFPQQVLIHPGYHFSSDLVFLDPPYVGIKNVGGTNWINAGLPAGPYGWTDFAGVLLLSSGVQGIYYKEPNKDAVTLIPGAPAALGLVTFANRVVLGATDVSSNFDLMGIGWSDATADYKGWDPAQGAGSETMIGSMKRADRFMGFGLIGFNTLGIVNRRSLWIATKTGDEFEPLDIQSRLEDVGATHADTVLPTDYGVLFLSDDGVRVFDGNQAPVISDPINAQLRPFHESDAISASIDPQRKRYYLHTPTTTWVYDLPRKVWYRSPRQYLASIWFPDQGSSGPTWGSAGGTWASQTKAWWQLDPQESNGSMYFLRSNLLGKQDFTSALDFSTPLTPRWFDKIDVGPNPDTLFTSQILYLTYESTATSTIAVWLPDQAGEYTQVTTATLPSTSGKVDRVQVPFVHTGRTLGLGITISSGFPRLRRATLSYQPTSEL